ncbi:MAG: hypothetical protein M3O87_04190, partial [Candidatus Dormibacteraeota bacterium]|nr:hypothetical protein [Candidatus Dormibacteraeota bacterium]
RRQLTNGRYRRLDVPIQRLDRLHEALAIDLQGQRSDRVQQRSSALRAVEAASRSPLRSRETPSVSRGTATAPDRRQMIESVAWAQAASPDSVPRRETVAEPAARLGRIAGKLARHYLREAEREARRRIDSSHHHGQERGE